MNTLLTKFFVVFLFWFCFTNENGDSHHIFQHLENCLTHSECSFVRWTLQQARILLLVHWRYIKSSQWNSWVDEDVFKGGQLLPNCSQKKIAGLGIAAFFRKSLFPHQQPGWPLFKLTWLEMLAGEKHWFFHCVSLNEVTILT